MTKSLKFDIRRAAPADAATVVEFNRRLAWETERLQLDPELLQRGVAAVLRGEAEALYFVAATDAGVVGQMMLTREWSDWRNGWFYWIQSVYVAPEFRQCGVFRGIYRHAVEFVTQQPDAVGLRLYVEEHNQVAQETYLRLGMRRAGYHVLEHPIRNVPIAVPPEST